MVQIFITVIDYNGREKTLDCLDSLEKLHTQGMNITIVVIDNYPAGKFELPDKKYKNSIIVLKPDVNKGFSGGHNVGITYALKNNADYVLILNNDTYVDPMLVSKLLSAAEADDK